MSRFLFAELARRGVFRVAAAYAAVAWLLIQVAETLLPLYGFGDGAVRTLVTVLVIGSVPAVILAWVFEWTPDGIRVDSKTEGHTPRRLKWLDRAIVIVLVVAVVYLAVDKFIIRAPVPAAFGATSIAVCPFDNLSPDPDQDYFASGIAEELLNLLARIPELRVISRTSSFEVCEQGLGIPAIAERLDVTHVLEGSVRRTGDRLRVTAQLIEGPSDANIWSDTWDRDLGDVFDVQDEIGREVVSRLEILLVHGMPRSERTDPLAYALTLRAMILEESGSGSAEDNRRVVTLLQQALELDPDYVTALLRLNTHAWALKEMYQQDVEEMTRLERETYRHMVEIAPDDPRVIARQGWYRFEVENDWQGAARLMERAVDLAPGNITTVSWAAGFAYIIGRFDKSIELSKRALSIDPLCNECAYYLLRASYYAGYWDAALDAYRQFQDLGGGGGQYTLGKIYLFQGDPDKALEVFSAGSGGNAIRGGQVMALYELGRHAEAVALFEALQAAPGDEWRVNIAEAAAWIGNADAAFEWLEKEHGSNDYQLFFLNINDPVFASLHDDPRWQALARKVNLSDEQRAAIRFDPHLPQ